MRPLALATELRFAEHWLPVDRAKGRSFSRLKSFYVFKFKVFKIFNVLSGQKNIFFFRFENTPSIHR